MKRFFSRIWGIWLMLTFIYIFGSMLMGTQIGIVGLFVPFGIVNGTAAFSKPLVLLVGIGGLVLAHFVIKKFQLGVAASIITSLIFLLVITFLVDMILWQVWCSWALAMGRECLSF